MPTTEWLRKTFKTFQGREFQVTLCKITGKKSGPTLALIAGQHGMEHVGPVALMQFIEEISSEDFAGTLYACPCANPLALEIDYEFYPEKEDLDKLKDFYYSRFCHEYCIFGMGRDKGPNYYNMNRLWRREGDYGVAGEIVRWLWDEAVGKADVVIDLHCAQPRRPFIYCSNPEANIIAAFFGVQTIHMCDPNVDDFNRHQLGFQVNAIPGRYEFCVEFSRQHELFEEEYLLAKQGFRNVMRGIGMLEGNVIPERPVYVFNFNQEGVALKAGAVGYVNYHVGVDTMVKKGDHLCDIRSLETLEVLERVNAPINGMTGARTHLPITKIGETVISVSPAELFAPAGKPLPKFRI